MSDFIERFKNTAGEDLIVATGETKRSRSLTQAAVVTVQAVNGITNGVTFTLEGSIDGVNWYTLAYTTGSDTAYVKTAVVLAASAKTLLFLPPADFVRYVRVNVSSANAVGTTFTYAGSR